MAKSGSKFIVSTPDRSRLKYKNPHLKPENEAHVREWSLVELQRFFVSCGFDISRSGHTRANQFDPFDSCIFIELSCTHSSYQQFLVSVGLIADLDYMPRHLLVTTEYAGFHNTGGIGTFVREQRITYGFGETLCLIGGEQTYEKQLLVESQLVAPCMLFDPVDLHSLPIEDQFLKAVQQLLFYFPNLATIQYGDYQGIGCRIAQAKRAGMIPKHLTIIVNCHGMTHYLENAFESWLGFSHLSVAEKEKIAVENADVATFPSKFLRDLFAEVGIAAPKENTYLLRYPFHQPMAPLATTENVDTLIFFGKRSRMKGYDLFLQVLTDDILYWKNKGVTTICLIGPEVALDAECGVKLELLRQYYKVEEFVGLGRTQSMELLHQLAHHSICLMPYLGDNHPYALLDAAFSSIFPLMVKAGGVTEMFPDRFKKVCLAESSSTEIKKKLTYLLNLESGYFHLLRESFSSSMFNAQNEINNHVRAFSQKIQNAKFQLKPGRATIIVPVFHTALNYIEELIFGINNQTIQPLEVIFVDDASEENYSAQLRETLTQLQVPYRVIKHEVNKGLAGARNTGLSACNSEYIINVDSDDVPLNDFVRDIVFTLCENPSSAAAVPYLCAFDEGTDFNTIKVGGYVYRPLGDGVVASQLDNLLGHANAGFRTSVLREFNGWDDSSKAMWEDWALYLKLTSAGRKISIIPKIGCLYRVRKQSMLRTYRTWPAMRRLAKNMTGLPSYENYRLQAMMRNYKGIVEKEIQLNGSNIALSQSVLRYEATLNRAGIRAVITITNHIARYPFLFRTVRKCGKVLWKLARVIKRFFYKIGLLGK
jgi:glycosyltransferase involved in cell wall biosynthesis